MIDLDETIKTLAHRAMVLITTSADGTGDALSGNEAFRHAFAQALREAQNLARWEESEACAKIVDEYRDADFRRMAREETNMVLGLITALRTETSQQIRKRIPNTSTNLGEKK